MRIISLLLFTVVCLGERADLYVDSRANPITVDGLIEAEWENHDAQMLEGEGISASWKGCYDNTYYYFLIEVEDPQMLTNRVDLALYGWSGSCDLGPPPWPLDDRVDPPEYFYQIFWSRNSGLVSVYERGLSFQGNSSLMQNHGVLLNYSITADGYVLEVAVPGGLIEGSLGAGGDHSWTDDIRLSLGIDLFGAPDLYWPGPSKPSALCDMGLISFYGWPKNAISATPSTLREESSGGLMEVMLHFPDTEASLEYTLNKNHEWISASLNERQMEITVEPNTGRHRITWISFKGPEDTYGSCRVEQYGITGTPWDFDFEDPLTGKGYSGWFSSYQPPFLLFREVDASIDPLSGIPLYSDEHRRWLYSKGIRGDSVYFYDYEMKHWWWTSESLYPYIYLIGEPSRWLWFARGWSSAQTRWFYDFKAQAWRRASEL